MQVKCPTCKKPVVWEKSKWRPFCSDRCKLLDLGAWASESYTIPDETVSQANLDHMIKRDEEI